MLHTQQGQFAPTMMKAVINIGISAGLDDLDIGIMLPPRLCSICALKWSTNLAGATK